MARISAKTAAALQDGTGTSPSPAAAANPNPNAAEVRAFFEELRLSLAEETLGVQRVHLWSARKRAPGRDRLDFWRRRGSSSRKRKEGAESAEKSSGEDEEREKEREKGKEKESGEMKRKEKEKRAPGALPVRVRVVYEMATIGPRDIRDLLIVRSLLHAMFCDRVDSLNCDCRVER